MNASELARALGLSAPSLSAWRGGRARPEAHYRTALRRLLGEAFREEVWMTKRERAIAHGSHETPSAPPSGHAVTADLSKAG